MIADHTKTTSDIKGLIADGKLKAELPKELNSSMKSKLDDLKSAKAEDFASTYDKQQVAAHKDAVSLFERYSKSGDNAPLKAWANKTLPALKHHLAMAEKLEDSAKKNATVGKSSDKKN